MAEKTLEDGKKIVRGESVAYISRYKCFIRLADGRLEISRETGPAHSFDESVLFRWERVRHPVGQDFLDRVNRVLDTRFTERDFQLEAIEAGERSRSFYLK